MPPNALNLINHMKLHVNGKMAERERDRKKKEQESAEAISGLKSTEAVVVSLYNSLTSSVLFGALSGFHAPIAIQTL